MPVTGPITDALIIDGAALVNTKPPGTSKTFDEYAKEVILPYIEHNAHRHSRIDVVFDMYFDDSLKGETRKKRGSGARRKVTENSRPPKSWNTFLRCDEIKTDFFAFLDDRIVAVNSNTHVVVTKNEEVLSNKAFDTEPLSPCNHEEADTRMFLHAKDAAINGSKSIMLIRSDTSLLLLVWHALDCLW